MSEPQLVPVCEVRLVGRSGREKQRTVKDTFLISAWVAAYAGVLIVFRVTGAMEGLLSRSRRGHERAETNPQTWDRANASAQEE
jgi:hypothetical protein